MLQNAATSPLGLPVAAIEVPNPAPRLRLLHLFVWTLLCAVSMAVHREAALALPAQPDFSKLQILTLLSAYAVGQGTAFASLLLWWACRRAGGRFLSSPGTWLWLVLGLQGVADLLCTAALPIVGLDAYFWLYQVNSFATCWLFLWPAMVVKSPWRWRLFFWLALFVHLVRAFDLLFGHRFAVIGLALLLIAAIDLRQRPRYAWTHWPGIAVALCDDALTLLTQYLF